MSRESETGCIFWIVIIMIFGLFNILEENPMILIYSALCLTGAVLFIFVLNFLHSLFLLFFNNKIKTILRFEDKETRTYFNELLTKNRKEQVDIDMRYYKFISSSKIFEC